MAYKVIWAPKAIITFENVINYLQNHWTEKQIKYFVERTEKTIHLLSNNPYLFRSSEKEDLHEVIITKHNILLYQVSVKEHSIELLAFFDTRQNPKKKYRTK
jgi:plasmid stabilization system protein ParE